VRNSLSIRDRALQAAEKYGTEQGETQFQHNGAAGPRGQRKHTAPRSQLWRAFTGRVRRVLEMGSRRFAGREALLSAARQQGGGGRDAAPRGRHNLKMMHVEWVTPTRKMR